MGDDEVAVGVGVGVVMGWAKGSRGPSGVGRGGEIPGAPSGVLAAGHGAGSY